MGKKENKKLLVSENSICENFERVSEYITPELKAIISAIDAYVIKNKDVCIVASFVAFDDEKIKNNDENIIVEGSDRVLAFGTLDTVRMSLNELRDIIEDEAEEGFVNLCYTEQPNSDPFNINPLQKGRA